MWRLGMYHPALVILVTGLVFILAFGGLGYIRGHGLSAQLALEGLLVTALFTFLVWATNISFHPIAFLIILYLISMRARILLDAGNFFLNAGHIPTAISLYKLALKIWPDSTSRCIAWINIGVAKIRSGALQEAIAILEELLEKHKESLGFRNEAACLFNLGLAYRRAGQKDKAVHCLREAADLFPDSLYGRRARELLKELGRSPAEEQDE
ncbi:MAG: tetratricopeptide repeat protein [Candidatus Bathyarchaeia archaeon]